MEIERRFLVKDIKELELGNYERKQIIQDYLYVDKLTAIRKRKVIEDNNEKYVYTIKTDKSGLSVNEIEKEISKEIYDNLVPKKEYNQINKIRYIIPYSNNLKIELDVFKGIFFGIIFAEIEYLSTKQANDIKIPKWFGTEISNKITNSMMASMPKEKIFHILNNL